MEAFDHPTGPIRGPQEGLTPGDLTQGLGEFDAQQAQTEFGRKGPIRTNPEGLGAQKAVRLNLAHAPMLARRVKATLASVGGTENACPEAQKIRFDSPRRVRELAPIWARKPIVLARFWLSCSPQLP